jgi:hypothetical protein
MIQARVVRINVPRKVTPARVIEEPHEVLLFLRTELGWTQKQFAEKFGVSLIVYRSWEKEPGTPGSRRPNRFVIDAINGHVRKHIKPEYIEEAYERNHTADVIKPDSGVHAGSPPGNQECVPSGQPGVP